MSTCIRLSSIKYETQHNRVEAKALTLPLHFHPRQYETPLEALLLKVDKSSEAEKFLGLAVSEKARECVESREDQQGTTWQVRHLTRSDIMAFSIAIIRVVDAVVSRLVVRLMPLYHYISDLIPVTPFH